jgi:hypothetical protein
MRDRRRSALHEAGRFFAYLCGLAPVEARVDEASGCTWPTYPDDFGVRDPEILGSLTGYFAEVFAEPSSRRVAARRAAGDFETFGLLLENKYRCRGRELAAHARRYRERARRMVSRRWTEIYALSRELEKYGHLDQEHADGILVAVGEVRRRRRERSNVQRRMR